MAKHPKGWLSPANKKLTSVTFRLPQDTVDLLAAAAAVTGLSKRKVVTQAIKEFAARPDIERTPASPVRPAPPVRVGFFIADADGKIVGAGSGVISSGPDPS